MTTSVTFRAWQRDAECRGEQRRYFFPPTWPERRDEKDRRERHAKSLCEGCPVRAECLEFALSSNEAYGVWGGLNELERKHLATRAVASPR